MFYGVNSLANLIANSMSPPTFPVLSPTMLCVHAKVADRRGVQKRSTQPSGKEGYWALGCRSLTAVEDCIYIIAIIDFGGN